MHFIKKPVFLWVTVLVFSILATVHLSATPAASSPAYFELKVYHLASDSQVAVVENYLQSYYVPSLHTAGLRNIGVFKAISNDTATDKKLYVFIPFNSLKQWEKYRNEAVTKEAAGDGSAYNAISYNKPAYNRLETIFLKAFEEMGLLTASKLEAPKSERVYELRSYESPGEKIFRNKVKMFNQGGEIKLFERLGFNAVFYGEVVFGAKMPNLMYMTSFKNMPAREEHWKTFTNDPEWKTLSAMPEYQNNVSHIDITFLRPTEYSDL